MKIAIYARSTKDNHSAYIEQIYNILKDLDNNILLKGNFLV